MAVAVGNAFNGPALGFTVVLAKVLLIPGTVELESGGFAEVAVIPRAVLRLDKVGVAGFVLGFALQDTLSNFSAGLMLLIYRPYDVGNAVIAGGMSGKVEAMSLVSTRRDCQFMQ